MKIKYQDDIQEFRLNMYSEIGTALHNAVRVGNHDTIEWLIDHGANPLIKDPHGRTPYSLRAITKWMENVMCYYGSS